MDVFLDKIVRETRRRERGNVRGGAIKKREISRTLLSINLHFSVLFVRKFAAFFDSPSPVLCGRHIWKPPNVKEGRRGISDTRISLSRD